MSDNIYILIILIMIATFMYWYHINKCNICIDYHNMHTTTKYKKRKKTKKSNIKKKVSFKEEESAAKNDSENSSISIND